ncbi:heavy-metal-associated domain-containing protein [Cupriavidus pauculus]|uniref:heavy-metal-associated domain-containing protein n=1 Tax=Cupriavidus pauculus TaxID=82633 RepID=UPI0030F757C9
MRKILLGLVFTAWMGLAWAATPKQVVLQVENMTCPACSITIEKALDKVPGVTARRVDTQAATVTVAFDAERTNAAAIAKAITDAGFPATAKAGAKSG